jgi:predicted nucleotide-binding protein
LKDHLHEKHGLTVIAYETGARAGFTIQEVLEELSGSASIAFLLHTGEDAAVDGTLRTRENVVHETGLFQGVLGFKRAIVLLEEGCSEFSNIIGINQIRFATGNIKEAFGDVLAVIRRELGKSLFE